VEVADQVGQEVAGTRHHLPVVLPAGEGLVDVPRELQVRDRRAIEGAVVALTQPRVLVPRDVGAVERQVHCLHRAPQVGADDRRQVLVSPALTERPRLLPAGLGQFARQPAGGDPGFVVSGGRVSLVDQVHRHLRPSPGPWPLFGRTVPALATARGYLGEGTGAGGRGGAGAIVFRPGRSSSTRTSVTPARIRTPPKNWTSVGNSPSTSQANRIAKDRKSTRLNSSHVKISYA